MVSVVSLASLELLLESGASWMQYQSGPGMGGSEPEPPEPPLPDGDAILSEELLDDEGDDEDDGDPDDEDDEEEDDEGDDGELDEDDELDDELDELDDDDPDDDDPAGQHTNPYTGRVSPFTVAVTPWGIANTDHWSRYCPSWQPATPRTSRPPARTFCGTPIRTAPSSPQMAA